MIMTKKKEAKAKKKDRTKKKEAKAKKKDRTSRSTEAGEQLEMFDVRPKQGKAIVEAVRLYKKYQQARIEALDKEIEQKKVILKLVKEENLQPLATGQIKFEFGGITVSVMPRDELVQVKDKAGDNE